MNRIRCTEAGKLKAECDRVLSEIVRGRGHCEFRFVKGCTGKADTCAHIIGRAKLATRWAIANSAAACFTCHEWADHSAEGQRRLEQWAKTRLGASYDALVERSREVGTHKHVYQLQDELDILTEVRDSLRDMRRYSASATG